MNCFPPKLWLRQATGAALLLCLSACVSTPAVQQVGAANALCEHNGTTLSSDFSGGGQHACAVRPDGFALSVWPEPAVAGVINPSPWYAFKVEGESVGPVNVLLDYNKFRHRYAPWISLDGENWSQLDAESFSVSEDGRVTSLSLPAVSGSYYVAGQPLRSISEIEKTTQRLVDTFNLTSEVVGYSHEGRPITALTAGSPDAEKLIVALTLQHPPEITGATAFIAFAERFLSAMPAEALSSTRVLLFPLANPDGVENGHWRHNKGGVDINRDWYAVQQPEVAAIQARIRSEAEGKTLSAFMDFHSTWRSLVYTPPLDLEGTDMRFPNALKKVFDETFTPQPEWIVGHNADNGTSKNWALRTFNTPGLTIEIGDDSPLAETQLIGQLTADVLIESLMAD